MLNDFERKILESYREGSDMGYIIESFGITYKRLKQILIYYKNKNKEGRTFTDDFKKIIAERDMNGVSRRQISLELEINANTVKKACEQFGQTFKEKASSNNEFTRIELDKFDLKRCPSCNSKNVNLVEDNTTYCKECGSECIHHKIIEKETVKDKKGKDKVIENEIGYYALSVNWEHLD